MRPLNDLVDKGFAAISLLQKEPWLLFPISAAPKTRQALRQNKSSSISFWNSALVVSVSSDLKAYLNKAKAMKLVICGGTGYVATELIRQGLALPQISNLVVLSRRPITVPDSPNAAKLKQVLIEKYDEYPEDVKKELSGANGCIW